MILILKSSGMSNIVASFLAHIYFVLAAYNNSLLLQPILATSKIIHVWDVWIMISQSLHNNTRY